MHTAQLPIDNRLGINTTGPKLDLNAIRENARLNRLEAQKNYKRQYDKKTNINLYEIGDEVLLKRSHGKFPKLNPKWIGPFTVVKRVGPVNWGIKDSAGKTKIVHHDLLKPALSKRDATITPSTTNTGATRNTTITTTPIILPTTPPTTPPITPPTIAPEQIVDQRDDINRDDSNGTNTIDQHNNTNILPAETNIPNFTQSGRISRPVIGNRLIDELIN